LNGKVAGNSAVGSAEMIAFAPSIGTICCYRRESVIQQIRDASN
jgi:hypothetical protein